MPCSRSIPFTSLAHCLTRRNACTDDVDSTDENDRDNRQQRALMAFLRQAAGGNSAFRDMFGAEAALILSRVANAVSRHARFFPAHVSWR